MPRVVGVRFKKVGKIYYFDPTEEDYPVGTKVIVETARGIEYGDVCIAPREVPDDQVVQPLKKVMRTGTDHDAEVVEENRRKQKEAFAIAREKIAGHNLDMHLCDVEYTFDRSKVIFYFTAESRIDFRELVKDLASVFRTRIEMRQIGVRDEAKLIGGIGPCGRILCCTSFLGEFSPVSIRMAKDQNLSLNPTKISGVCGRLMCCLRYEQETYEAAKKDPTLAPGYAPPPVEKVEEYVKEYMEEETPRTAPPFYGLPARGQSAPAGGGQARVSSAPQGQPSSTGPGQRGAPSGGEQRRGGPPATGQRPPAQPGQPGQSGQRQGGGFRPGQGQGQQPARGQGQPQAQRGGQPRPAGQPQGSRPQPAQPGAAAEAESGLAGEGHRKRRRRHRRRGHGGGSNTDGQSGPPPTSE